VGQSPSLFGPEPRHGEEAITEVGGADGSSRYAIPFKVVPARGQIGGNSSEAGSKEPWDVLQQHKPGSKYANASEELGPEPSFVVLSSASSGDTDGLAGEPAANEVDTLHVLPLDLCHVTQVRYVGPMLRQDFAAERVDLRLPHGLHTGALQPELEATDTGEQRPDLHV